MHDRRAAPALVKALKGYRKGDTDDDFRAAFQSVRETKEAGKAVDSTLVDGMWTAFATFQASQGSPNAVRGAMLSVKDRSWGDACVSKIDARTNLGTPDVEFWQRTCVQLVGGFKFGGAARSLVSVLLTPGQKALASDVELAPQTMS